MYFAVCVHTDILDNYETNEFSWLYCLKYMA